MELIIGRSPTLTVLHSVESHIISHRVKVGWESGIFFHCCYSICIFKKKSESTHMQTGLLPPCWRQSRICWWQCTDTLPRDWWHEGYWSAGSPLQGCSLDLSPCLCLFHLPSTCTDRLMKTEALAPSMKSDAGQEHVAFLLFQKASHKETND